jgi:hypothetical protein
VFDLTFEELDFVFFILAKDRIQRRADILSAMTGRNAYPTNLTEAFPGAPLPTTNH